MTSPKLQIEELIEGQADKETTVNEGTRRLEIFGAYFVSRSIGDTSAPGSPADGDAYVLGAVPTGVWTGHAHDVAYYKSNAWEFVEPYVGLRCYVVDEAVDYRYIGGGSPGPWVSLGST